ncbi:hypothetical protein M758_10G001200 [Ceratodon purpureus]|nr:hypothetical protein M758_10G001200 [Ceratodon purpureus]
MLFAIFGPLCAAILCWAQTSARACESSHTLPAPPPAPNGLYLVCHLDGERRRWFLVLFLGLRFEIGRLEHSLILSHGFTASLHKWLLDIFNLSLGVSS